MLSLSLISLMSLLSVLTVWTRNVFMSLMYSVLLFVNVTVVLFILGFEFLALVNVLVYAGALAVLFLFVIMLLEVPATELRAYYRGYSALALLGLVVPFYSGMTRVATNADRVTPILNPALESISAIGYAFYVRYADVLILNSLVLTIALFGALVLVNSSAAVSSR
jgi:NADH:ubiquinone oxidoreductase subunit 6 (subunit J)